MMQQMQASMPSLGGEAGMTKTPPRNKKQRKVDSELTEQQS